MKNLKKALLAAVLMVLNFGCGGSSRDSNPIDNPLQDLTGVYRTDSTSSVPSITALEIRNGSSATDLEVIVLRNGLSSEERTYFNELNEIFFADSQFGRELNLFEFQEGRTVLNERVDGASLVNACTQPIPLDDRGMDFVYCIELRREDEALRATGDLVMNAFAFGERVRQIRVPFSVFIRDRLFVDFFGTWSGQVDFRNGNVRNLVLETGSALTLTFQPVTTSEFILRPLDRNQRIRLGNEGFVLRPETRPQSDLENSVTPFVNFVYVSEVDGNRQIQFNSFVRQQGVIEGNIQLSLPGRSLEILGTYVLNQE